MQWDPSNKIHPSVLVGPDVQMRLGNTIGPHCVLNGPIHLGNYNRLNTGVLLEGNVKIGHDNQFFPYVCIGQAGEMGAKRDVIPSGGWIQIGNNCVVREYVNIHAPVRTEATVLEDDCYIMSKAYLAHDVRIGKGAILSAGVLIGGRGQVGAFANIGMGAVIHQRSAVGQGAMIGMQAAVKRDVPPYCVAVGVPARILKFNRLAAERMGFQGSDLDIIQGNFKAILSGAFEQDHPIVTAIRTFLQEYPEALRNL